MHQTLHFSVVEEQIRATTLGTQETEAILVAEYVAFHQIQAIRQGITLVAREDQLSIALHGTQTATQGFQWLFIGQLENLGQLFP